MAREDPTEDIIRREIAEAARILREDGHAASLAAIQAKFDKHFPDDDKDDKDGPQKPDRKDDPGKSGASSRKSLWWGDISDE